MTPGAAARVACGSRACNRMLAFVFSMPTGEARRERPASTIAATRVSSRHRGRSCPSPGAIARLARSAADVASRRVLGRSAAHQPRATLPHGFGQLARRATCDNFRLAAGAQGQYQALGIMFDGPFPFLDSDVYKWLEAVGWELGRAPGSGLGGDGRRGHRRRSRRRSATDGYLNTFVQVARARPRVQRPPVRPRAVLHRPPDPGGGRVAPGPRRRPAAGHRGARRRRDRPRPSARHGGTGSTATRRSRWRWSSCPGSPANALPGARRGCIELRGTGLLGAGRFGAPYWQDHLPGPRGDRTSPAMPSASSTSTRSGRCRGGDRRREPAPRGPPALARHGRDALLPDGRRSAAGRATRPSATRTSSRPTRPMPRRARRSRASCSPGACCSRPANPSTPTRSSGPSTTACCPGCRRRDPVLLRQPAPAPDPPGRAPRRARANAPRGTPAPAARRTSCGVRGSNTSRRRTTTGIQIHQYATAEIRATVPAGERPPVGRDRLPVGRPGPGPRPGDARRAVDPVAAGPRLVDRGPSLVAGAEVRRRPPSRDRRRDRSVLPRVVAARRRRSCSTSTCPAGSSQPAPQVDAVRGCVALERGPLVYCIESADLAGRRRARGPALDPTAAPDAVPGRTSGPGVCRPGGGRPSDPGGRRRSTLAAIPYHAWANRTVEAMRVWIPTARRRGLGDATDEPRAAVRSTRGR